MWEFMHWGGEVGVEFVDKKGQNSEGTKELEHSGSSRDFLSLFLHSLELIRFREMLCGVLRQ